MQASEVLGGRYELRGVLGRGGMAEVRDAWDMRLHRPVAVKLLHPAFSLDPDSRRRFETEARAAASLTHPHIVAVHDSGEHAGTPFIVMERLSGRTLADALASGPQPQDRVRSILTDVLSAISAAHGAGILHRDIKPANILFTDSGDVKVADFGIAKSGASATMTGQIVGTMAYLSPDRLAGRPATVADDLYAVGVVGYEALAGHRPFPQEDLPVLARAIAEDRPPPLAVVRPDVDPALTSVIERAMERDPQRRYPTADAMSAALSVAPQHFPVRTPTRVLSEPLPPPSTMVVSAPARASRRRVLLAAAAALAAIILAVFLLLFDPGQQPPEPDPVGTSTSTPAPSPSLAPPPPAPAPPVQVDEGPPAKKGNGAKKPKGPRGHE